MQSKLTTKELCEELGVHRATIHRWRKAGLPAIRWGPRSILFDLEKVKEWVIKHEVNKDDESYIVTRNKRET